MHWKYYIPHSWDSPTAVWEDIWLLPCDSNCGGESIWLTIDALGDASDPTHGSERAEFQEEALTKLGQNDYWLDVEAGEMIVRARDFSKEELLGWVEIWAKEAGLEVTALTEAPLEDFLGTNEHARAIELLSAQHRNGQLPTN